VRSSSGWILDWRSNGDSSHDGTVPRVLDRNIVDEARVMILVRIGSAGHSAVRLGAGERIASISTRRH